MERIGDRAPPRPALGRMKLAMAMVLVSFVSFFGAPLLAGEPKANEPGPEAEPAKIELELEARASLEPRAPPSPMALLPAPPGATVSSLGIQRPFGVPMALHYARSELPAQEVRSFYVTAMDRLGLHATVTGDGRGALFVSALLPGGTYMVGVAIFPTERGCDLFPSTLSIDELVKGPLARGEEERALERGEQLLRRLTLVGPAR